MIGSLGWQAWYTIGVLLITVVALVREVARPDIVLLGSLGLLLVAGIVPPEQAFDGFSNSAVLAVAALFVVAAGVQQTEALGFLDRLVFAKRKSLARALPQLMFPTAFLSAFLNNTPIVAMFIPRVRQWAIDSKLVASKLLIPLSYAAIVGGMMTLIGTSTNIVVSGLLEESGYPPFNMFDFTWVGLPVALAVVIFFALVGHRLLPDRTRRGQDQEDGLKDCMFEVRVAPRSYMIGLTVEEADLRALGEAYLFQVRRGEHLMAARPDEVLEGGDVLTFIGNVSVLDDLLERTGLERVVSSVDNREDHLLPLFEAVVADSSSLVDKTLKQANFRETYGGVVLGIKRREQQLNTSLGTTPIKAGDLLIVEAREGFDRRWNANRDEFYLVASRRLEKKKANTKKAPVAIIILLGMVILAATGLMPLVTATFAAALGMVATRCLRFADARKSVNIGVLIVIAAALGIGKAFESTGLAEIMAQGLLSLTSTLGPLGLLVALYITTNILTELITHKAAAVLMLPVALSVAAATGANYKAFAIVIAVSAAASFMTPIGYQTNLMVMAAGSYRFRDYFKVGLPVSLLVMTIAVTVIYFVWM